MEQFRKIITALLGGKIGIEQAQQALAQLVEREPQMSGEFVRLLNQLYSERRLDPQRYSLLRSSVMAPQTIAQSPTGGAPVTPASPTGDGQSSQGPGAMGGGPEAADQADNKPDDQQDGQQSDGAKTQFRMPAATPPVTPDDAAGKTAFRTPTSRDASGQYRTPTSGPSQTGATSGTMGGTGSNWSSPSAWTGSGAGDSPVTVGSIIKDRFVLEELVGRGGMGMVFKARDLRKEEAQDRNPYVALKVLNEEFKQHPDSLKALQREARKHV